MCVPAPSPPPQAGSTTRVLRNAAQPELAVPSAEAYGALLTAQRITLPVEQRQDAIWEQVAAMAKQVEGRNGEREAGKWGVRCMISCI